VTKFAPDTPESFSDFLQGINKYDCLDSLLLVRDRLERLHLHTAAIERMNALIKARQRSVTLMRKITSPRYFSRKYFRDADENGCIKIPKIYLSTLITSKGNMRLSWKPVPGHENAWSHPDKFGKAPARLDELAIIHQFSPLILENEEYDLNSINGLAQSWITAASLEFISALEADASWACEVVAHTSSVKTVLDPNGMIRAWSSIHPGAIPERFEGQY
jgi:hypothetical protein